MTTYSEFLAVFLLSKIDDKTHAQLTQNRRHKKGDFFHTRSRAYLITISRYEEHDDDDHRSRHTHG